MRLIAALFLLAASLSADATNYFRWGWEDTRPSWGVDGRGTFNPFYGCPSGSAPAGSCTTRDCTVSHTGSCSMKLVVIGNDGGNQQMGADPINNKPAYPLNVIRASPALYYRWWMRINTGFSWGSHGGGQKTKASRTTATTSPTRNYTGYLHHTLGVAIGECDGAGNPGCLTNTGGGTGGGITNNVAFDFDTVADSQWHEYVVMVKPNTSATCTAGTNCDAVITLWVDNVLIGSNSNWKLSDVVAAQTFIDIWGGWMVYPYFQLNGSASDGGTIYIDDVSTDDVYNSSIALAKPTNPRISQLDQFMRYTAANYRHLGQFQKVLL